MIAYTYIGKQRNCHSQVSIHLHMQESEFCTKHETQPPSRTYLKRVRVSIQ